MLKSEHASERDHSSRLNLIKNLSRNLNDSNFCVKILKINSDWNLTPQNVHHITYYCHQQQQLCSKVISWKQSNRLFQMTSKCFLNGHPRPLFIYFRSFSSKHHNLNNKLMWKNVHPVYGAGIQTNDIQSMSLLPYPLDQSSHPSKPLIAWWLIQRMPCFVGSIFPTSN